MVTLQAFAYTGHDISLGSTNQVNLLESVKLLASYNKSLNEGVLENDPQNAKYPSHTVQQEQMALVLRFHIGALFALSLQIII